MGEVTVFTVSLYQLTKDLLETDGVT